MTRKIFIQKLFVCGAATLAGVCWLMEQAAPRKLLRAVRVKKYPGPLKPLPKTYQRGKWSG